MRRLYLYVRLTWKLGRLLLYSPRAVRMDSLYRWLSGSGSRRELALSTDALSQHQQSITQVQTLD
jgi:hypothetical protein